MRAHVMLKNGPFNGELFSMLMPQEPKQKLRITGAGAEVTGNGKVPVACYTLVGTAKIPELGESHMNAGYIFEGAMESPPALVDYVIERRDE